MRKYPTFVIPSVARDLVFSATYEEEIPRLHLGMTGVTQSLRGETRFSHFTSTHFSFAHCFHMRTNPVAQRMPATVNIQR